MLVLSKRSREQVRLPSTLLCECARHSEAAAVFVHRGGLSTLCRLLTSDPEAWLRSHAQQAVVALCRQPPLLPTILSTVSAGSALLLLSHHSKCNPQAAACIEQVAI